MASQLANEFLQARLYQDWDAFLLGGPAVVAHQVNNRALFPSAFHALTGMGCQAHVLFPCLFVFLNSRGLGVEFPWSEDLPRIEETLKRLHRRVSANNKKQGFKTMIGSGLEPVFATFTDFRSTQSRLLKSMDRYKLELDNVRRQLPRQDLVRQYGRTVICIYVRGVLGKPALSRIENLLDCFRKKGELTGNLARDIKRFQDNHPGFSESGAEFLAMEHDASSRLGALNWGQFRKTGSF